MDQLEKFGNAIGRLLTVVVGPLLDWMRQSYLKVGNATVFTWVTVGVLFCATFGGMEYLRIQDRKPLIAAQAENERALTEWRMLSNDKLRHENAAANIVRMRFNLASGERDGDDIKVTAVAPGAVKFHVEAYRDQDANPQKLLREFTASPYSFAHADVPGQGDTIIMQLHAEFAGGVLIKHGQLIYVSVEEPQ